MNKRITSLSILSVKDKNYNDLLKKRDNCDRLRSY